mgnify:CR=1 FL=1
MNGKRFLYVLGAALLTVTGCATTQNAQEASGSSRASAQNPPMIIEVVSPYGFDKTDQLVQEGIKKDGWSVPKVYDWRVIAKKGGADPGPFKM